MFGLGGSEMLVILIIVLLIFGPSQLPNLARGLGQAMREFRKAQREMNDELTRDDRSPAPPAPKAPENKPVQ